MAVLAPLALTAPTQAYAGTPGCVTVKEYRSVIKGMSQTQVARRFGTYYKPYWGRVSSTYDDDYTKDVDREWRICNRYGKPRAWYNGGVTVSFHKEADFETGEFPPGPLLSYYKSRWS